MLVLLSDPELSPLLRLFHQNLLLQNGRVLGHVQNLERVLIQSSGCLHAHGLAGAGRLDASGEVALVVGGGVEPFEGAFLGGFEGGEGFVREGVVVVVAVLVFLRVLGELVGVVGFDLFGLDDLAAGLGGRAGFFVGVVMAVGSAEDVLGADYALVGFYRGWVV